MSLLDTAVGKWRGILVAHGVPEECLTTRQGACPLCGGNTRFRFDDKEGRGTWYCNHCGAGTGYTLLQQFKNWTPSETLKAVEDVIGKVEKMTLPRQHAPGSIEKLCKDLWSSAKYPNLALDYLRGRGLTLRDLPAAIRGTEAMPYPGMRENKQGLLARVVDADGQLVTLHRTFTDDVDTRKATLPCIDGKTMTGAAVRLASVPLSKGLIVGEGIETALAARECVFRASKQNLSAWAAVSANGMEHLFIPADVRTLLIFGDNDASYTGQAAAYALAKRAVHRGLRAEVYIPRVPGTDWLDVLNAWQKDDDPETAARIKRDVVDSIGIPMTELQEKFDAHIVAASNESGTTGRTEFAVA